MSERRIANLLTAAAIALVIISVIYQAWWHVGTAAMVMLLAAGYASEAESSETKANTDTDTKDNICS